MSRAYTTFEKIKEAYEVSTISNNVFKNTVESIDWKLVSTKFGTFRFENDDCVLVAKSLDPFQTGARPHVISKSDGSMFAV